MRTVDTRSTRCTRSREARPCPSASFRVSHRCHTCLLHPTSYSPLFIVFVLVFFQQRPSSPDPTQPRRRRRHALKPIPGRSAPRSSRVICRTAVSSTESRPRGAELGSESLPNVEEPLRERRGWKLALVHLAEYACRGNKEDDETCTYNANDDSHVFHEAHSVPQPLNRRHLLHPPLLEDKPIVRHGREEGRETSDQQARWAEAKRESVTSTIGVGPELSCPYIDTKTPIELNTEEVKVAGHA